MRPQERLRGKARFGAVLRRGGSWTNRFLVLRALPNSLPQSRYGITVARGVGKAVVRNRVRRRIREGIHSLSPQGGWDVVLIARREAAAVDFWALREALSDLLRRARLLKVG